MADEAAGRHIPGQRVPDRWPTDVPRWSRLRPGAQHTITTILVVDQQPDNLRPLRLRLARSGYQVLKAADGAEALRATVDLKPDVVLLDLDLPDLDGIEVIAGIRGWSTLPIIVLSVRDSCDDKVAALDAGADDYVTKPFVMAELLARVRVVVRRLTSPSSSEGEAAIDAGSFIVDLVRKKVHKDGANVHLTPNEWGILELLARNPGRLVTQRQILQHVWGPDHLEASNYLRVYLGQLRRKLEPVPARPRHLLTEAGMGYRFEL